MESKNIAWLVTAICAFGAYIMLRRTGSSNVPSLVENDNTDNDMLAKFTQYDMRSHGANLSRGYRNNNPLNIDQSSNAWKGKVTPPEDKRFETFVSLPYGYRAALMTMRTYITKYGLNTIYKIINRWAPASDGNNPLSYANNVCKIINERLGWGGVTPDTVVARTDEDLLTAMAYAMSIVENGDKEYARALGLPNMEIIKQGWRLI